MATLGDLFIRHYNGSSYERLRKDEHVSRAPIDFAFQGGRCVIVYATCGVNYDMVKRRWGPLFHWDGRCHSCVIKVFASFVCLFFRWTGAAKRGRATPGARASTQGGGMETGAATGSRPNNAGTETG